MDKIINENNFIPVTLFILVMSLFSITLSFPFYNLQSKKLKNGNLFFVHKNGIDICDFNVTRILRTEMFFSIEEQIITDKMKNVLIKQFEDGYLICLINGKIYIFDDLGHFLYKSENINTNKTVNYYSLNIKDNYHYYVGLYSNESLNLYYYEYYKEANTTKLIAESGNIKKSEKWMWFFNVDYAFENKGFDCHIMYNKNKGEALACFFIISNNNKLYWSIEFFSVEGNLINSQSNYTSIKKEITNPSWVGYFKVDVSSDKTKALICSFISGNCDFCFYYDTDQTENEININYYEFPGDIICYPGYSEFKVNYFIENDQYVFSCRSYNKSNIKYVIYNITNEKKLIYINKDLKKEDECHDLNGFTPFYSKEINKYYFITDYICNKTWDPEEYKCELEKCSECDRSSAEKNLCQVCNETKGYFPLKSVSFDGKILNLSNLSNVYIDCFNDTTKPSNYFFNSNEKYYEPCFERCAKCEIGGDIINNNCMECDFGFIAKPGKNNSFNCNVKCPYYFYYTVFGQYKCTDLTICPEDYYLLIKEKGQCIEDCKKDGEYNYQYNGECLKECPNSYSANTENICLVNNTHKCSLSQRELPVKNEKIREKEIDNLAILYVKEFHYTDNHISLFNYSNYQIAIYKNFECISDLSLDIPSVDLGECYQKIQEVYAIEDNLILAVVGQRNEGIKYPIISSLSVYSPYNGNKLDIINTCEEKGLNVKEDISMKIEDKEKYNFVQYLTKQDVDVFNLSSDFYTDICYFFESPIKKDISLKDRIKLFFPNITLCENGCTIKGINSTTMKADCECKINNLINNDNILTNNAWYKSQIGEIQELLNEINLEIMKCGSHLFKHRNISSYIGFFIFLSLIIIQIVLTILYFLKNLKPLKNYFFNILNNFLIYIKKKESAPPKKSGETKKVKFSNEKIIKTQNKTKKNKNKKYKANKTETSPKIGNKNDNKINSINLNNSTIRSFNSNKNTKSNITVFTLPNKQNKLDDKISSDLISSVSKSNLVYLNEFKIDMENYLQTELENLAFEEVKERDDRKFGEYFSDQIKSNLLIVEIILNKDAFKPRTIRILLFIINIDFYLFINALFINEEFISEVFNSNNDNFFSFLPRCIDRIFYTILFKAILNYIIDFFFIEEKKIKIILKSKSNTIEDVKNKINQILEKVLKRYFFFIVFSFIITLFSLYYITCFNYRYYYITNEWIKSSIFIIILMEIVSFVTILIESSLRFLSLKFNSEKFYKLSLVFS